MTAAPLKRKSKTMAGIGLVLVVAFASVGHSIASVHNNNKEEELNAAGDQFARRQVEGETKGTRPFSSRKLGRRGLRNLESSASSLSMSMIQGDAEYAWDGKWPAPDTTTTTGATEASDWDSWKSTGKSNKDTSKASKSSSKDWWSAAPTVSNAPSSEKEWSDWKSTGKSGKSTCRSAKSSKVSSKWDSWSVSPTVSNAPSVSKPAWRASWGSEKSGKSAKIFGDKSGKSSSGKSTAWPTVSGAPSSSGWDWWSGSKSSKKSKSCETKEETCPPQDKSLKHVPKEGVFDCTDDVSESLQNIAKYLSGSPFSGNVTCDGDGEYEVLSDQYASPNVVTMPSCIIQPLNELDVQAAVLFGAKCGYKITARSGGHSFVGMSSCDSDEEPCLQMDMGLIDHIEVSEVDGGKQLNVGPGVQLDSLAEALVEENVFVPAGECNDIGLGGHVQTGGLGEFGAMFGYTSQNVEDFKCVLADGSLQAVTKPTKKTSKFNDDLFYAVMGGASGWFCVIVDIGLSTVKEDDYWSFYWEVNFVYDDATKPGIGNMLHKYGELVEEIDTSKWNIWWNIVGAKTALNQATQGFQSFNYVQLDLAWVVSKSSVSSESEAFDEAQEFYNNLVDECTSCVLLDDLPLIPPLQAAFFSSYGVKKPLSQLYKEIVIFVWESFQLDGIPFATSYQQGPKFPTGDELKELLARVDSVMPNDGTEPVFVISQWVGLPAERFADPDCALPFQNDAFGVTVDVWDLTRGALVDSFPEQLRAVQDYVISVVGDVDHRMFWAAYEDPCLQCGDFEQYYESREKYDQLVEIKRCVDPGDVFLNRMLGP